MKKLSLRIESAPRSLSIKSTLLLMLAIASSVISCKKEKDAGEEQIKAATSIRLVHSSFLTSTSTADLFVDDVKLNSGGAITFSGASAYFPATAGSRKIVVKNAAGVSLADTVLTISDGRQYSLFLKDRSWADAVTQIVSPLKSGLIPVIDNNTGIPAKGKAKIRFVNMSSQPLNSLAAQITFSRLDKVGSTTVSTTLTQTLGADALTFSSDYTTEEAGEITIRALGANSNTVDLTTTLEADKLYTFYVVSTQYTVKTPTKSPISLIVVQNK
ncbi:DUF4397 domain-containing protein [Pedobacter heparinus]|uniref:DUF4397 domain-containing protein n=1 Tax=Pedobacter heparinus (strain ATCC 13125 / DSM 2366 / CIP 104194 / JCM 7457 / NBRC 12017 / NCIMB 9290 / NRRL B-14731 / HIM 762-3) TaxID=485917 RepID=C6XZ88_PEDHD|nr:DUF4397 domain-containing protein [Pedobacter heparinus]ACU02570.1 hypothetical protein Phep_0346 [Pedobacter heparinus DSM 2366]